MGNLPIPALSEDGQIAHPTGWLAALRSAPYICSKT